MHVVSPHSVNDLENQLQKFLDIVGRKSWFKRAEALAREHHQSPFLWKIVRDYHWLELVIAHQAEVLELEGALESDRWDALDVAGLRFAASCVALHAKLTPVGKRVLEGRLQDSLRAVNGFAPLYLELDEAQRLMSAGFNVTFPDMEGRGRMDLMFERGAFRAQVECKSLSVDAGRRVHRKDFYRLIDTFRDAIQTHAQEREACVIVANLADRLSPNLVAQRELRQAVRRAIDAGDGFEVRTRDFVVSRYRLDAFVPTPLAGDLQPVRDAIEHRFGAGCHVAGAAQENGNGCIVAVRSDREDDTSKPLLEALREAADQMDTAMPSFIAVQFQDLHSADWAKSNVQRQMDILSHALFERYGARHVNATYFTCFEAEEFPDGTIGAMGLSIPNPRPKFEITPTDVEPYF